MSFKDLIRRLSTIRKDASGSDKHGYNAADPSPSPAKPAPSPAPGPAPSPQPNRKDPAPEKKPGRPSPRPGEKPRPVTDPKNYLRLLPSEYFHTLSPPLKSELTGSDPFSNSHAPLEKLEILTVDDLNRSIEKTTSYKTRIRSSSIFQEIRECEKGHEKKIQSLIKGYLEEITGPLYHTVSENLDIAWKNPYDTRDESFSGSLNKYDNAYETSDSKSRAKNRSKYGNEKNSQLNDISGTSSNTDTDKNDEYEEEQPPDMDYIRDTIIKSEIYYLLVQGFGILYMEGFFEMMGRELTGICEKLPDLYREFHWNGHLTHHRVFGEVMSGIRLPDNVDRMMESTKSEGRVWNRVEPVIDEETGNILSVRATAHARAETGVVLAHESLKGVFQLLTPWARVNENYLRPAEMGIVRRALNSYWAEIRQFALGPSFFKMFQSTLERMNLSASPARAEFYLSIQNIVAGPAETRQEFLRHLASAEGSEIQASEKWRNILLISLNSPDSSGN